MTKNIISPPEILAPVGGLEQLYAAVKSGADAVYFGAAGFNARRNARNFSDADFCEAVHYCHIRNVKVYITLNTLVFDNEYDEMLKTLRLIAESGADAVIVQDLSVVQAVKMHCPTLPLHASTQMAVHNVGGAVLLRQMGFSRIVLARENSLSDIRAIRQAVDTELEFFVHGAHCMSASGMCYMSSALGARSGNRGLCAQPCRLNFKAGKREYALSLRDMSLIPHLNELAEAGICSFKIEGRMKRPEYVAAAVDACKKQLHGEMPSLEDLRSVFSRSGFTDGYFLGKRNLSMFGTRTKEDVTAAQKVLPALARLYRDEPKNAGLDLRFSARKDAPCELTLSDGTNTLSVSGEIPQAARQLALSEEMALKSLTKFGGTPYYIKSTQVCIEDGLMLPAAALNALRRDAAEKLNALRTGTPHPFEETEPNAKPIPPVYGGRALRLRFETAEQIPESIRCERLILPLSQINEPVMEKYGEKLTAELPVLMYPDTEPKNRDKLLRLKEKGLKYVLCENIGGIYLTKSVGLTPLGGMMLNIINSRSLRVCYDLGVKDITFSFELPFDKMRQIVAPCQTGFVAYGHLPLMRFRCCPMQGQAGCAGCTGKNTLTDRRGEKLTVLCSEKQYSTLYNPVALYTGNMKMPAADFATLYFTYESREECEKIIDCFNKGISFFDRKTSGLYDKELL